MYSVTVCVVLVFVGNVSSFVLSRTRRDLEQTIFDVYGPPRVTKQVYPRPHHTTLKPDHTATKKYSEEPEERIPQGVIENIGNPVKKSKPDAESSAPHLKLNPDQAAIRKPVAEPEMYIPQEVLDNIFGPPINRPPSKPDVESSAPHFYSAIVDNVKLTRRIDEKVAEQFGSASPAPEAMTATENSTATDETVTFDYDNRFLSRTLLRTQWINNREASEKDVKNTDNPHARLQPPQGEQSGPSGSGNERGLLEPGTFENRHVSSEPFPLDSTSLEPGCLEPRPGCGESRSLKPTLESKQHILKPTSFTNASGKNTVSKSLVLVLVCFCIEILIFIYSN